MDPDGNNQINLTSNSADNWHPSWSTADQRIVFGMYPDPSSGDYNYEICIMDSDGQNQRNLTNHPSGDLHPSRSPDGH